MVWGAVAASGVGSSVASYFEKLEQTIYGDSP